MIQDTWCIPYFNLTNFHIIWISSVLTKFTISWTIMIRSHPQILFVILSKFNQINELQFIWNHLRSYDFLINSRQIKFFWLSLISLIEEINIYDSFSFIPCDIKTTILLVFPLSLLNHSFYWNDVNFYLFRVV